MFKEKITNEQLAELPPVRFGGRIIVVENGAAVKAACEELSRERLLGFDTETKPSFKAGVINKVALLQLSAGDRCFLFRLNRTKFKKKIVALLENEEIVKVGADVAGDLRALLQLRRFRPQGFVDLQSVAGQWGIADRSVRKMAGSILGVKVSKAQRLSNWEAEQLNQAQQDYAATDAWICLEMYRKLQASPKTEPKNVPAAK